MDNVATEKGEFTGCVGEQALLWNKIEELRQSMNKKKKGLSTSYEQKRRRLLIQSQPYSGAGVPQEDSVIESVGGETTPRLGWPAASQNSK